MANKSLIFINLIKDARGIYLMRFIVLILLVVLSLTVLACTPAAQQQSTDILTNTDGLEKDSSSQDAQTQKTVLLAGSETTPYQEFNQEAYNQALADDKKIFLQWYATWCPSCRAEQKIAQPFFDSLDDEDVVGFRVNFKDKDTSDDEEDLAREFGVSTQSTKIFIVNGERVHKTPQHYIVNKQYQDNFDTYFG